VDWSDAALVGSRELTTDDRGRGEREYIIRMGDVSSSIQQNCHHFNMTPITGGVERSVAILISQIGLSQEEGKDLKQETRF
jgi:hypothetical protein